MKKTNRGWEKNLPYPKTYLPSLSKSLNRVALEKKKSNFSVRHAMFSIISPAYPWMFKGCFPTKCPKVCRSLKTKVLFVSKVAGC